MNKRDLATAEAIIEEANSWGFIFTHNKEDEVREMIYAALTTARKDAREAAWLPIETAPKDGTRILLACDDHVWLDEWWKGDGANSGWASAVAWEQAGGKYTRPPTHWMPLPQPPIEAAANSGEGAGDG